MNIVDSVRHQLARIPRLTVWGADTERPAANPVTTYYLIVVPALLLTAFGLVMGFSASAVSHIFDQQSPYLSFGRQLLIITVSVAFAIGANLLPPKFWYRLAVPGFIVSLVVQALVLSPLGVAVNGNRNWIALPIIGRVQPSEFLKLTLILVLAVGLGRAGARLNDWRQMMVLALAPITLAIGAIMLGHDMGTALVVAVAALGALWVAGLPGSWFAGMIGLAVPTLAFLIASSPSRLRRVTDALPWTEKVRNLSAPEQTDHALWALGSGGVTGLGPGASREKWNYLQEAHTDFILAILGEEFGLLGTLTVVVCLGMLVWAMVRLCMNTTDQFIAITAAGVASWIGAQGIINIMSVTGLGPVIGVPLPLVSYGGSSFLFTALAIGVVAGFAREEAGMWRIGSPDEASAGRDPRVAPRRRKVRRSRTEDKK